MFQLDPTTNPLQIPYWQRLCSEANVKLQTAQEFPENTLQFCYSQTLNAYNGDPDSNTDIPGTTLNWDFASATQQQLYMAALAVLEQLTIQDPTNVTMATVLGSTSMQTLLETFPGPENEVWNYSTAQLGIGPNAVEVAALKWVEGPTQSGQSSTILVFYPPQK